MVNLMTKKEVKERLIKMNDDLKIVGWNWNQWKYEGVVSFVGVSKNHIVTSMCYYVDDTDYINYMPGMTWVKAF